VYSAIREAIDILSSTLFISIAANIALRVQENIGFAWRFNHNNDQFHVGTHIFSKQNLNAKKKTFEVSLGRQDRTCLHDIKTQFTFVNIVAPVEAPANAVSVWIWSSLHV